MIAVLLVLKGVLSEIISNWVIWRTWSTSEVVPADGFAANDGADTAASKRAATVRIMPILLNMVSSYLFIGFSGMRIEPGPVVCGQGHSNAELNLFHAGDRCRRATIATRAGDYKSILTYLQKIKFNLKLKSLMVL
jgi:hypothetical protein